MTIQRSRNTDCDSGPGRLWAIKESREHPVWSGNDGGEIRGHGERGEGEDWVGTVCEEEGQREGGGRISTISLNIEGTGIDIGFVDERAKHFLGSC